MLGEKIRLPLGSLPHFRASIAALLTTAPSLGVKTGIRCGAVAKTYLHKPMTVWISSMVKFALRLVKSGSTACPSFKILLHGVETSLS